MKTPFLWQFPSNGLRSDKPRCVRELKEDLSDTRWEPGETAPINNSTVSEGATQSPRTTEPFWNEPKYDSKTGIKCSCLIHWVK